MGRAGFVALVAAFAGLSGNGAARAERTWADGVGIGVALAMPAAGPALSARLDGRRSATLVLGDLSGESGASVQVQLDIARRERAGDPRGGYLFLGAGHAPLYSLLRGGYGHKWRVASLTFHVELGLNVPVRIDDDAGLTAVGVFFPFGVGLRYEFGAD